MRILMLAVCAISTMLISPLQVPAAVAPSAPSANPLIFDDEFNGPGLDLTKWYRCYPYADESTGCANGPPIDLEWYWKYNVSVSGGMLALTAREQDVHGYDYTSGLVVTGGSTHKLPGFTFLTDTWR